MKQTGSFMRLITTGAFGRSTSEATSEPAIANQKNLNVGANLSRCDLRLMGRELAIGLQDQAKPVYVWGVQYLDGSVYASDMVNGIWKLTAAK